MKECPVCRAVSFDDAQVCYGCLHRFAPGEGARQDPKAKAMESAMDGEGGMNRGDAACPAPAAQAASLAAPVAPAATQMAQAAVQEPAAVPQTVSVNVPASDIVVRIEVVGAAVGVDGAGASSASSGITTEQALALLRRSGSQRLSATSCPAEEQRGASAGRKTQGAAAPARERARHAARGEREVVVA